MTPSTSSQPAPKRSWLPTTRRFHRLAGLFALGWLAILSITGIVLTHPEWRWPHRVLVPGLTAPAQKASQHAHDRLSLLAPDPANPRRLIVGGLAGLWSTGAAGKGWSRIGFAGADTIPQVFRIVQVQATNALWLATDDGIWRLAGGSGRAEQWALNGEEVSALDVRADGTLLAIIAQSRIVSIDMGTRSIADLRVGDARVSGLPDEVSVNRWGFDLHLGIGFFPIPVSRFVNDIAGVAMIVLAVSGFLYWWLPRRWKRLGKAGPSGKHKRATLLWLFRSHAVIAGVIVFVPLVYLSATGVFLDHKLWFQSWSPQLKLPVAATTGNYRLNSLDRELLGLAAAPGRPERLVVQTRLGYIASDDGGRSFSFDNAFPLNLATSWTRLKTHRVGDVEIVGELIGRNHWRPAGSASWRPLPKLPGYVPLSAASLPDGRILLRTYSGLAVGRPETGFAAVPLVLPPSEGLDVTYLFRTIHGLLIFDKKLIWFNDAVAIASVILMFTGLYNWLSRNRRWG